MAQTPADFTKLIDQLRESKWFRRIDPEIWGDLTLRLSHVRLSPGEALFHQGDPGGAIYVVLAGRLKAFKVADDGGETALGEMTAGSTVGEIQVLTGGMRTATVRATDDSELVRIPTEVFDELLRRSPETRREMVAVNQRRLHRSLLADALPNLFGPLDEEAMSELRSIGTWRELRRGETLFQQGDPGENCYLLLRGRLVVVVKDEQGRESIVGEVSRGEPVGEGALITGEPHSASVRAIRDSRVLAIPRGSFQDIISRFPQMLMALTRILMQRLSRATATPREGAARGARRISAIAVVPLGADVPATEVAGRVAAALEAFGPTLCLSSERLSEVHGLRSTGSATRDDPAGIRLAAWLDEQEPRYRFIVYEADQTPSAWTRKCTRQADLILLVTRAGHVPDALALEQSRDDRPEVELRKMLLLLHSDGRRRPRATGKWLDYLGLDRHLHLRWDRPADFERLARLVAGRAVGVALGGGGARAFAHIGVIQALAEANIEIDGIGGTSAGSLIAAQVAMGWDVETMVECNRRIFLEGKPHRDFTLPFVSILSGRRGRGLLDSTFSDRAIEDLWLSYFAVSANLTTAGQMIHRRGPVAAAVWASMAVPGVVAPGVSHGDLLVDGGVLNNLPGDVVRRLWGGRVITVDVSAETEERFKYGGGELPSAAAILRSRMNPFAKKVEVPGIAEILIRSSMLGSVTHTAAAKADADLFLKPPVGEFGMFDTKALDRLIEIGYEHTRERLKEWDSSSGR